MNTRRRTRLFSRPLAEVMREATHPLIRKKGKFYTALLRDWPTIVGAERAAYMSPLRVQFHQREEDGATLHLKVSAAKAPELAYMQEQILEQLARYFGYKAIHKLVLHPDHAMATVTAAPALKPLPEDVPRDFKAIFERMQRYFSNKA